MQTTQLTVTALTRYLKRKFDVDPHLQQVTVVGELSNFRLRANSHQYFSLKDESARISAVMYRSAFEKVPFQLEEGMKVIATGRVTLYEPSGSYQLTIDRLEPDGIGALYLALEQLKQRLKAQGLLDLPKKTLPQFPRKIAVITSPSGAVIRDILTTIRRRYPIVQVTVFPTRVQGKEAVSEIVSAFEEVAKRQDDYDTVIVARGGGSIEDLWCFNDEAVAHAILRCELPVIAAIGHETDTTIADLVADMRAPTPTAAAELAVPVLVEVKHYLAQRQAHLYRLMQQQLALLQKRYERLKQSYILTQPERLYQPYIQQVDRLKTQLLSHMQQQLQQKRYASQTLQQQLYSYQPLQRIQHHRATLQQLTHRLNTSVSNQLNRQRTHLAHCTQLLDACSPLKIMARGYAVVEQQGQLIKSAQELERQQPLHITLTDGKIAATIQEIEVLSD
ncbi:MAG: exodeoxyribonuclease VII large subunit [Aerococcaceae bacterium]|nr:exodeoxyribonuclease VII large subunit [Aerococcaceae bacterium]